jgi:hypothetical protein
MPISQKISHFFISFISFILCSSIEYTDEPELIYNGNPLIPIENTLTDLLGLFSETRSYDKILL